MPTTVNRWITCAQVGVVGSPLYARVGHMKGKEKVKKPAAKETATVTVRLYPSTHKLLKIQAANSQLSVARLIHHLAQGAH